MWPQRWRRSLSISGDESPATSPRLDPSLSFRDLRLLVPDDENADVTTTTTSSSRNRIPTIRPSVFHRVRAATSALRTWKASRATAEKRIVLYYTSLRIVRKTFDECRAVRSILRGFRVAVDERDLSMDSRFLSELKQILGRKVLSLPRVFIDGRYVGGFEEIQQLHESGELREVVEGAAPAKAGVCEGCGGVRFVLCDACNGSRKCYYEKGGGGFRSCGVCNENGLVRCSDCCYV